MASRREFERIVRSHRRQQLTWTKDSVKRIDRILQAAARETVQKLRKYAGTGTLSEQYLNALLADLGRTLDDLKTGYGDLMGLHLLGSAQISADREAMVAQLVLEGGELEKATNGLHPSMSKDLYINSVGHVEVTFGLVSEQAVNAVYRRVYQDGLTLSDRLWRLDAVTRRGIEDAVVQAVSTGKSARNLAKELKSYLTDTGQANGRYNAARLARTEINTAHREGQVQSATDSDGQLKNHIQAIGWRLSASHPKPDICDVWASQDLNDLGPGNYLPGSVPVDHPHGLCFLVNVLKAHPDMQFVSNEPKPGEVSEAQKAAYGVTE